MLFSVPGLRDEGDDAFVDPDVPMVDDGCEGRFARAYIQDEIPWMDLRHEVRDLMTLAVPELSVYEDTDFEDEYMPDDGMEACWAEPVQDEQPSVAEQVPSGVGMIRAPVAQAMLAMPVAVSLIGAASEAPVLIAQPEVQEVDVPAVDIGAIVDDLVSEAETVCIAEAIAIDAAVMEAMTVISQVVCDDVVVVEDEPAEITEDCPAVTFSFGSQEIRRSGWRVCFSF